MSTLKVQLEKLQSWVRAHPWKAGAVLCGVLALWYGYHGVDIFSQNKTERDVLSARDDAAAAMEPLGKSLAGQMLAAQKQAGTTGLAGAQENIRSLFVDTVKEAELVEIHMVDLTAAYNNPAAFGAGKLAVLEAAANGEQVAFRIIKASGGNKLAMAKMVGEGQTGVLAYVQLPLTEINKAMQQRIPDKGYLALRQDQVSLVTHGDEGLAATAEGNAVKIAQTPWRVVASAPLAEKGMFEAGGLAELGLALLFLLGVAACLMAPAYLKKRFASSALAEDDGTGMT